MTARTRSHRSSRRGFSSGSLKAALAVGLLLILLAVATVQTASNSVPRTRAGIDTFAIGANQLRPAQCSQLNLTRVLSGNGNITGTFAAELILGGSASQTLSGGGGNDCIFGGGGNDAIYGGFGTDVCIGGSGTDAFSSCETQVQ